MLQENKASPTLEILMNVCGLFAIEDYHFQIWSPTIKLEHIEKTYETTDFRKLVLDTDWKPICKIGST